MPGAGAVSPVSHHLHHHQHAEAGADDGPHPFEETTLPGSAGVSLDGLGGDHDFAFLESNPIDFG